MVNMLHIFYRINGQKWCAEEVASFLSKCFLLSFNQDGSVDYILAIFFFNIYIVLMFFGY